MAVHEVESTPVVETAAGTGVVKVRTAASYSAGVVPVHKNAAASGVVKVQTVAAATGVVPVLYNIHKIVNSAAYRYWRAFVTGATQKFYIRGLEFDGARQAGFPYTSADPPANPDFVAIDRGSALAVTKAKLWMHNIVAAAAIKLQGGPVPPQAGVTTDGTGWIDVPIAGFGTLVGAGNDWAFGFTVKTPSDLTGTQRICTDHNAGGGNQVIEVNMGTTLGAIVNNEISQGFAVSASAVYRVLISFLASDKKFRLYKDGVLQATSGAMAATIGAGSDFAFMRAGGFNGQYLKSGAILGNAIIYGEYLDATKALAEFNGTFTAGAALKGKWLMTEGSGATVDDSSPENNNGTLTAGASWSNALAMVDETMQ